MYRFILIDLGSAGRQSDGDTFSSSSFGKALKDCHMILPDPLLLAGTKEPSLPYVMVGDEAFPLRNYLFAGNHLPGN